MREEQVCREKTKNNRWRTEIWITTNTDIQCVKELFWHPITHFFRWEYQNEERIFSWFWLYHSVDRSLYFILRENKISFNTVCKNFGRLSINRWISYEKKSFEHFTFPFISLLLYTKIFWIIPHSIEKTFLYTLISFRNENNIDRASKNREYLKPYDFHRKLRFFSLVEMQIQLKIHRSIEKKTLNRMVSFVSRNNKLKEVLVTNYN
jgi:hypothetical protein